MSLKLVKCKVGWAVEHEGKTVCWYDDEVHARKALEFWSLLLEG